MNQDLTDKEKENLKNLLREYKKGKITSDETIWFIDDIVFLKIRKEFNVLFRQ